MRCERSMEMSCCRILWEARPWGLCLVAIARGHLFLTFRVLNQSAVHAILLYTVLVSIWERNRETGTTSAWPGRRCERSRAERGGIACICVYEWVLACSHKSRWWLVGTHFYHVTSGLSGLLAAARVCTTLSWNNNLRKTLIRYKNM